MISPEQHPLRTVFVGDQFIPASSYVEALSASGGGEVVDGRSLTWEGSKSDQHAAQHAMELHGADAVAPSPAVLAAVADAEAICVHFAPVSSAVLDAAPHLRLIAVARTGLQNVDLEAASVRGVAVTAAFGRNAGAVAELQLGLMLAETRNIARADASIKSGGWRKEFPGARIELAGRTVAMIGFGHVGRTFARRLRGFEPDLLVFDPYADDAALTEVGAHRAASLDAAFAGGDFVVVQVPVTKETIGFIGATQLAAMKPTAYFVNVARSRVVDYDALYETLAAGRIAGAGLDVFDDEPLAEDSRWRALDNVTMTTHFGGDTAETNTASARLVIDNVLEFARTGRASNAVNIAVQSSR